MTDGWVFDYDDLIILIDFMAQNDYSVGELADAVAKPWKYAGELVEAKAALTGRASTLTPEPPPSGDFECCASGRCEVCTPGYVWGNQR